MSEWISVDAISANRRVLVLTAEEIHVSATYDNRDEEWYDDEGEAVYLVTHWQPLPEPPTK